MLRTEKSTAFTLLIWGSLGIACVFADVDLPDTAPGQQPDTTQEPPLQSPAEQGDQLPQEAATQSEPTKFTIGDRPASENPSTGNTTEVEKSDQPTTSTRPKRVPLTPQLVSLRKRVRRCLDHYYKNPIGTRDNSPWSIMHAMLAFGIDSQVAHGRKGGPKVNTTSWLCGNGQCRNRRLFDVRNSELFPRTGPGFQGHEGQFLTMLAQSKVAIDYPLLIDGHEFAVSDLVDYEKRTCQPHSELTFKLIGLVHYLGTDATWKDDQDRSWTIPKMMKQELGQTIVDATCGGTHRLMGISYALAKRNKERKPVTDLWESAHKFVRRYQRKAWSWQNRDGSFSTNYFRGSSNDFDIERRLKTSGHILEWLVYSLPERELRKKSTIKAVRYLTNLMVTNRYHDWENGPRGHALRALVLYDQRVFGTREGQRSLTLTQLQEATRVASQ